MEQSHLSMFMRGSTKQRTSIVGGQNAFSSKNLDEDLVPPERIVGGSKGIEIVLMKENQKLRLG